MQVFGAFLSEPPKVSDGFYGNGESMLFSFKDEKLVVFLIFDFTISFKILFHIKKAKLDKTFFFLLGLQMVGQKQFLHKGFEKKSCGWWWRVCFIINFFIFIFNLQVF